MGLMTGKRGLIMGLANDKSIAWGIAEALQAEGAADRCDLCRGRDEKARFATGRTAQRDHRRRM